MRKLNFGLQSRMLVILGVFATLMTLGVGAIAIKAMALNLEDQIGQQALSVARVVAALPQVRLGLEQKDSRVLQPLADQLRAESGARFIVIGDTQEIRYAHPIPDRIGQKMVGGDNRRALAGEEYVSKAVGSLGPSIRGKVPVYALHELDGQPQIVGIVSVGFLLDQVQAKIDNYQKDLWWLALLALLVSLILAVLISDYFKRAIFGFEPQQIARLFQERNATIQSVREGIIAINQSGIVTTCNHAALDIFRQTNSDSIIGRNMQEIHPNSELLTVLQTGQPALDKEDLIGGHRVIVNRIPLLQDGKVIGAVSSFRRKDELDQLADQLNKMQAYADTLRSQAHEYSNKLHTIAGLIQIGASDQAIELIGQETQDHQTLLHLLIDAVPDPILSGCILGKYNRARELGLLLEVDPESEMSDLPDHLPRELLVTILANLIDNAMDANITHQGKIIRLSMTDIGNDLIFEVEDEGGGIDPKLADHLLEKGVSSKGGNQHGYGLHLVAQALQRLQGQIVFTPLAQGTRASVYIPKAPNLGKP